MVERSLSMREVAGSMPASSKLLPKKYINIKYIILNVLLIASTKHEFVGTAIELASSVIFSSSFISLMYSHTHLGHRGNDQFLQLTG